jgi:hypothetical protein
MTLSPSTSMRILAGVALALAGCGARASGGVSEDEGARAPGGQGGGVASLAPVARGGTSQVGAIAPTEISGQVPDEAAIPVESCDAPFGRGDSGGRACPYLAGGLCYADQRCACDRYCALGSACVIHGFLSPGRTQRIDCVEL